MKKTTTHICIAALPILVSVLFASKVSAATIHVVGGELRGAADVNVSGTRYDVQFLDGTCISLFSGCDDDSDFVFSDFGLALAASQALLDDVFLDGTLGDFDTNVSATRGIEATDIGVVLTPYSLDSSGLLDLVLAVSADNSVDELDDGVRSGVATSITNDLSDNLAVTYAVWSRSASSIPEPATILLFASGLFGIGLVRRGR